MFLRHLRRTRALLHVVDGSAPDPITDYVVVREELRMYNPTYCSRPHVVVLNKCDLLVGGGEGEKRCMQWCDAQAGRE
jgi:GTPase involved in cell partitioning and DNA repair